MKVLERQERVDAAGGQAVFVLHDEAGRIRESMLDGLEVPFPVLVDLERRTYREWGLKRVTFWRIYLDPRVWLKYAKLLLSGERLRKGGRDTRQLGGDFVVDPAGTIVYSRPQHADDRPPVGVLIEALEDAAAGTLRAED